MKRNKKSLPITKRTSVVVRWLCVFKQRRMMLMMKSMKLISLLALFQGRGVQPLPICEDRL